MTTNPTPLDLDAMRARAREAVWLPPVITGVNSPWPRNVKELSDDVLALADEVDRWRNWKPDDEMLAAIQEQAMDEHGDYRNSLAAASLYARALEARLRFLACEVRRLRAERDEALLALAGLRDLYAHDDE